MFYRLSASQRWTAWPSPLIIYTRARSPSVLHFSIVIRLVMNKRVCKTAEMYDGASSGSSRATNFSTALAEVYEAHFQEVAGQST